MLLSGWITMHGQQMLPESGVWGTSQGVVDAYGEVKVTGDITMIGVIRIPEGETLTITAEKDVLIKNTGICQVGDTYANGTAVSPGRSRFFTVKPEGKLIIKAKDGCKITLDGGADFSWNSTTYELSPGSSSRTLQSGIEVEGEMELYNVVIQNIRGSNANGGAINITSSSTGPVTLSKSKITKCTSELGSAIMMQGRYLVTLSDSEVSYCNSGGGTTNNCGGAIRTYGSVVSSLLLQNVDFLYNYAQRRVNFNNTLQSDGNGGALFWNARGTEETKCTIDGCKFLYNKSDDNGGAIKSQGTMEFVGGQTEIAYNTAPVGAGLYIEGYTGGSTVSGERTINYSLNDKMYIHDNNAPYYDYDGSFYPGKGAGVHLFFGDQMTLEMGSTINLQLSGARIENNISQGYGDEYPSQGGGIYFENTSLSSKGYKFNISLNYGSVLTNKASNGAGVYVYKGEVGSENINNNTLNISNNISSLNGGGIYIEEGSLAMANGSINNNNITGSGHGGGIYIENGDFTIEAGQLVGNSVSSGMGAGVYIVGSGTLGNFTMKGGEIKNNTASNNNGGGVYVNGGNFTLYQGTITGNISSGDGGGVYVNGGNFILNHSMGSISTNKAVNGGGVFLNNGNFDLVVGKITGNITSGLGGGVYLKGDDCIYQLKKGQIEDNEANNGGGVYLENGSFILAPDQGDNGSILGNIASSKGGGVYIADGGDFTMRGGTVAGNSTQVGNGGGIFLDGGSFYQTSGKINGNVAKTNGGGVCIMNNGNFTMSNGEITQNGTLQAGGDAVTINGGGVYLDGGALNVEAGSISDNGSVENGGGVYIMNGTVAMGSGKIQRNKCGQYGGGVYVYNSSLTEDKTVSFSGGTLEGNSARYGGGVCVDGLIILTIGNVEIAENIAVNGGGVCLMNKANMSFGAGQIKNNKALKTGSTLYSGVTAHNKDIAEVEGMGGGVYLNSNTTLIFNSAENLGLFGNLADNGADELFANGNGTTVNIPDVTYMKLDGYPGADNLKWIEDYITNDTDYAEGTKLLGDQYDGTNMRYRDMLSNNIQNIPQLSGGIDHNDPNDDRSRRYLCLALGYEVIYVILEKYGLERGESAIFTLNKGGAQQFRIILTGDGNESVKKKITVTAGEWTVREDEWSWTYDVKDSEGNPLPQRVIVKNVADEANRHFVFKNSKKGTTLPLYHEHIFENLLGN